MKKFVLLFFIVIITDFKCFSQFKTTFKTIRNITTYSEGKEKYILKEESNWFKIIDYTATPKPQKRSYIIIQDIPFHSKAVSTYQFYEIYSLKLSQDGDSYYYTKSSTGQEVIFSYNPNDDQQSILISRYSTNSKIVKKVWYYLD